MDSLELLERERSALALKIEQLSADHAAGAGCTHELRDELRADGGWQSERAPRVEGDGRREWNHGNAGGHRDADAERAMHRRPAAAHVVVIHARQIVVDERIRMDDLDGRGETARVVRAARRTIRGKK